MHLLKTQRGTNRRYRLLAATVVAVLIAFFPLITWAQKTKQDRAIDSLRHELRSAVLDTARIILLDKISFLYSSTNADEGIKAGNEALKLAENINWKKGIALANSEISLNHKYKSDYTQALEYAQRSLAIYEEIGDENGLAATMANTVLIYLSQSNYPLALSYALKALEKYDKLGDQKRAAAVMENTGSIYLELKNYKKALEYYREAYGINKRQGNRESSARNQGNIGIVLGTTGNYDSALTYHKAALKINDESGNGHATQINMANIGNIYLHLHDYPQAIAYQRQALDISQRLGDKSSIAINLGNLGETYFAIASDTSGFVNFKTLPGTNRMESCELAIDFLEKAVAMCREIGYAAPQLEFMQYLSEAYASQGNHHKSLEIYKSYSALKDSIFSNQNKLNIAQLESQKELGLKNKDLQIKEKQLHIKELELSRVRYQRFAYFAAVIISYVIFLFFYRNFRAKNLKLRREKRSVENSLVDSEFRLKQAQAIAHIGNWTMNNLTTMEAIWSDELCRIYGIPVIDNRQSFESFLSFIHPEDLPSVMEKIERARAHSINTSFFHRIVRKSGEIRHLYSQANYEFDDQGKPIGLYGVAHDITEITEHEEEIRKSNERFKLVNLASREAILDWDIANDRIIWGEGFSEIFGYQDKDRHNHLLTDNIHSHDVEFVRKEIQKNLQDPTCNSMTLEFRYLKANREIAYVALRGIFARDKDGKPLRAVGSMMDMTSLIEKNYVLEKQNAALKEVAWIQSHVVRGPLASLMGLMDLLRHKNEYGVNEKELLDHIDEATNNLDRVIHDIVRKADIAVTS